MNVVLKVAAVIVNKNGEKLLIKEKYTKEAGYKWNLVKGTYDNPNETLEDCVKREVEEEVGLRGVSMVGLKRIYHYGSAKEPKILFVFELEYLGDLVASLKNNQHDEDIVEIRWLKKPEIEAISKEDYMGAYVYGALKTDQKDLLIAKI